MSSHPSKTTIYLLVVVGLILSGFGANQAINANAFNASAFRADGQVTQLEKVTQRNKDSGYSYTPVVEYKDHNGHMQRYVTTKSSSQHAFDVGDHVVVLINPSDPNYPYSAELENFLYSDAIYSLTFGIIFIIMALGLIAVTRGGQKLKNR